MGLCRREFTKLAGSIGLAALAGGRASAQGTPNGFTLPVCFAGVNLGTCLYNYRSLPRPDDQQAYLQSLIEACRQTGVGLVEVNATYLEPPSRLPFSGIPRLWDPPLGGRQKEALEAMSGEEITAEREGLRDWRLFASPDYFARFADGLRAAGMRPFSYVMTFTPDMTEPEIEAIFRHAQALGVRVFSTNQTKIEMVPRLVPFAERHDMLLGFHNHTAVDDPNQVASVNSMERIISASPRVKINLDVGHFVATNQNVMAFINAHFNNITHFHMKDRQRNYGRVTAFGEGDTPIGEILEVIRWRERAAPVFVEYEYAGSGTPVEETRSSLDFLRAALESSGPVRRTE